MCPIARFTVSLLGEDDDPCHQFILIGAIEEALEVWAVEKLPGERAFWAHQADACWDDNHEYDGVIHTYWQPNKKAHGIKSRSRLEAAMRALIACYGEEA